MSWRKEDKTDFFPALPLGEKTRFNGLELHLADGQRSLYSMPINAGVIFPTGMQL